MRALPELLLLSLLLAGCRAPERAEPELPSPPPAAPTGEGADLALAPGAGEEWRLRPLGHAPPHFLPRGWADARTLWGLSGTSTFLVAADEPEFSVWTRGSWDAALSPDGGLLAWIDGRGAWTGARAGEPQLLLARGTAAGVEGDLGGPPLWSPDGRRLLLPWTGEAGPTFGAVEVPGGALTLLPRRGEGFLLVEPFAWLDPFRVLFTALPRLPGDGEAAEWSGVAMLDLRGGVPTLVAGGPGRGSLRPLARWGDGILVGGEGGIRILDPESGSSRPTGIPPGGRIVALDTTAALVVDAAGETGGEPEHALRLWSAATGRAVPLARVRGSDLRLAWSPGGERLAIGRVVRVPEPGVPGSFREEARTDLLERRVRR